MKKILIKLSLLTVALGIFQQSPQLAAKEALKVNLVAADFQEEADAACQVPDGLLLVEDTVSCNAAYSGCRQTFKSCVLPSCVHTVEGFYNDDHWYCPQEQLDACADQAYGKSASTIASACVSTLEGNPRLAKSATLQIDVIPIVPKPNTTAPEITDEEKGNLGFDENAADDDQATAGGEISAQGHGKPPLQVPGSQIQPLEASESGGCSLTAVRAGGTPTKDCLLCAMTLAPLLFAIRKRKTA